MGWQGVGGAYPDYHSLGVGLWAFHRPRPGCRARSAFRFPVVGDSEKSGRRWDAVSHSWLSPLSPVPQPLWHSHKRGVIEADLNQVRSLSCRLSGGLLHKKAMLRTAAKSCLLRIPIYVGETCQKSRDEDPACARDGIAASALRTGHAELQVAWGLGCSPTISAKSWGPRLPRGGCAVACST